LRLGSSAQRPAQVSALDFEDHGLLSSCALERSSGSHSLAAAAHRRRWPSQAEGSGWTLPAGGSTVTVRGDVGMDTQQIVEAFRRLPTDERVRLVEELWDEVARELEREPLSEAQQRLLDERIRQHQEHPADVEEWEAARDDLFRDL
jgi:putative addiction module component (TIGR02574 family)